MKRAFMGVLMAALLAVVLLGCTDAEVASANLSKAADQFEIYRRVVFYNGITNEYILQAEGFCSLGAETGELQLIVKLDDGRFLKHFLELSDNVTYFVEQLTPGMVSDARYRVVFKPSVVVPHIDLQ